MRVDDAVVDELIQNDGCRSGAFGRISATGIVRLALDLKDARAEIERLRAALEAKRKRTNG